MATVSPIGSTFRYNLFNTVYLLSPPQPVGDKFAPLTVCAQDDSRTDVDFPATGHNEMEDKTQVRSVNWK